MSSWVSNSRAAKDSYLRVKGWMGSGVGKGVMSSGRMTSGWIGSESVLLFGLLWNKRKLSMSGLMEA